MDPLHIETPLFESQKLSMESGRQVWLKFEALQPPGSFKIRGIGFACQEYARRGAKRFISSSGGNAGIAVAYAGRHLSIPVIVVVPETTTERAKNLIRQEGAELMVHGASWQEANALACSMVGETDAFLHPFDDPLLWQGHATMIDEVVRAGLKPDAVVLSVGGGGLLCGVLQGMHAAGWSDVSLVAVETLGAASLHAAVAAGQPVTLDAITSLATTLGARRVCDQAFAWTRRHPVHATTVTDHDDVQACLDVADEHRLIVEPACGAAVAATLQRRLAPLRTAANVLVILCGGLSTTYEDLWSMARLKPA